MDEIFALNRAKRLRFGGQTSSCPGHCAPKMRFLLSVCTACVFVFMYKLELLVFQSPIVDILIYVYINESFVLSISEERKRGTVSAIFPQDRKSSAYNIAKLHALIIHCV